MYKIEYRSAVWRDLTEITAYICFELHAPAAAERLAVALDKIAERVSEHPYMYKMYESVLPLREEYRIAPVGNYVLFYTVDEQEQTVDFCHMFYGGRDFEKLL